MKLGVSEQEAWELAEQVMSPNQYLAFWLHHHEGFSQRQIATMHGISRSTVQSRIEGGRLRLLRAVQLKEAA